MHKSIFKGAAALGALLALAACSKESATNGPGEINLAASLNNLQELKASDLGSRLTYVPLETSDSVLISNSWQIFPTDSKVVVQNTGSLYIGGLPSGDVLVFDLASGRFLNLVGHGGEDPTAFMMPYPSVDYAGKKVYYNGNNGKTIVYDIEGNFLGDFVPHDKHTARVYIVDTLIYTPHTNWNEIEYFGVTETTTSGNLIDSIRVYGNGEPSGVISFGGRVSMFGHPGVLPHTGNTMHIKAEGSPDNIKSGAPHLWLSEGGIPHAYPQFTDTIYRIVDQQVEPVYVLGLGEKGYPASEVGKRPVANDELLLTDILETPTSMVFGLRRGWFKETDDEFIALYDKQAGTTRAGDAHKGFVDDLMGFMPFYPTAVTPDGRWIGVLTINDIEKYLEENPDATVPDAIAPLLEGEEPNPVLVIID